MKLAKASGVSEQSNRTAINAATRNDCDFRGRGVHVSVESLPSLFPISRSTVAQNPVHLRQLLYLVNGL
jgi:hypothetical protein